MKEIRCGPAIVRIHGNPDHEKLREATVDFLKKAERCTSEKKEREKTA